MYGEATIEGYKLFLPTWWRRLILLAAFGVLGGLMAYSFVGLLEGVKVGLVVFLLAVLAGISTLWSP